MASRERDKLIAAAENNRRTANGRHKVPIGFSLRARCEAFTRAVVSHRPHRLFNTDNLAATTHATDWHVNRRRCGFWKQTGFLQIGIGSRSSNRNASI